MKHFLLTLLCILPLYASERSASAPIETPEVAAESFAGRLNQLFEQKKIDADVVRFLTAVSRVVDLAQRNKDSESAFDLVIKARELLAKEEDAKIGNDQFLTAVNTAQRLQPECLFTWKLLLAQSVHRAFALDGNAGDEFSASVGRIIPGKFYKPVHTFFLASLSPFHHAYDLRRAATASALAAVLPPEFLSPLHPAIISYAVAPGAVITDFGEQIYEKQNAERDLKGQGPNVVFNNKCVSSLAGLATIPHIRHTTKFDLSSNALSSLCADDLAAMPRLELIDLSHNEIQHIADNTFAGRPDLRALSLWGNPIQWRSTILTGLMNLHTLNLRNTGISEPPADLLLNAPNLIHLNLSENPLKRLPRRFFEENLELEDIDLRSCQLQVIESGLFTDRSKLKVINLIDNPGLLRAPLNEIDVPQLFIEPEVLLQIQANDRPRSNSIDLMTGMGVALILPPAMAGRPRKSSF